MALQTRYTATYVNVRNWPNTNTGAVVMVIDPNQPIACKGWVNSQYVNGSSRWLSTKSGYFIHVSGMQGGDASTNGLEYMGTVS